MAYNCQVNFCPKSVVFEKSPNCSLNQWGEPAFSKAAFTPVCRQAGKTSKHQRKKKVGAFSLCQAI